MLPLFCVRLEDLLLAVCNWLENRATPFIIETSLWSINVVAVRSSAPRCRVPLLTARSCCWINDTDEASCREIKWGWALEIPFGLFIWMVIITSGCTTLDMTPTWATDPWNDTYLEDRSSQPISNAAAQVALDSGEPLSYSQRSLRRRRSDDDEEEDLGST